MKWFGQLKKCRCWACTNVRNGGGYQPCHLNKSNAMILSPPKNPSGKEIFQDFELWIKSTSHYPKLMLIHGERLFIKDGDQYKILAIQLAYEAWTK
ncbi:hypothetical protein [uncultured Acinetobacter sp.]|uniref:hypothetical protein n=1 Tax=uncultured Acinetobacter sp. TaxID=165433 RepID=UPI0025908F95|nr:hypothetical protein [uncultured Acinetobacter sp.]